MRLVTNNNPVADEVVTDRIFGNLGQRLPSATTPDGLVDYDQRVQLMISDAQDFEESHLYQDREELTKYYYGLEPGLDEEEGRSTIVSTDVRDTIMGIVPSLIRIFAAQQNVIDFVANSEQQDDVAKQATDYVNHVFWKDNPGFMIAHGLIKDMLMVRTGIVKWWTDDVHEVTEEQFVGITEEQYMFLLSEVPDAEPVDVEDAGNGLINLSLRFAKSKPIVKVEAVPPEEFRISRDAKSVKTARLVGHERQVHIGELTRLGIPEDILEDMTSSLNWFSEEKFMRNPGLVDSGWLDDGVTYGEWYIRIDQDGDGIDELRYICTIGDDHVIISDEMVDAAKFALGTPDPIPHTAIGSSIAELVLDIQRIKTNLLRGVLDNMADVVRPRTVINETLVNLDDALNPEQSAIIRTKGDPNTTVMPIKTPYVGGETFEMISQLDAVRASRTGITEASKGLDPKAMQSTNVNGIDAIISGAQERIELIARIIAETVWTDLFRGLLKEVVNAPNAQRTLKVRGKWTNYNPSTFDPSMSVEVNPNLGKGSDMTRLMALREIKATQEGIVAKYGIKNPMVGPEEYRNTLVDILEIVNIKNPGRYFKELNPQVIEQIMTAPEEPAPEAVLAQAELEKVKAQTVKAISDKDTKERQLDMDDDFKRDKLMIDTAVKVLDIQATNKTDQQPKPELTGMDTPNE